MALSSEGMSIPGYWTRPPPNVGTVFTNGTLVATGTTAELGLRMALGATPAEVLRLVLGSGMRLTALGLAIGAVLGVAGARALANLLYDVQLLDFPTFAITAGVLLAVALFASYLPARRAARVDPIVALRHE